MAGRFAPRPTRASVRGGEGVGPRAVCPPPGVPRQAVAPGEGNGCGCRTGRWSWGWCSVRCGAGRAIRRSARCRTGRCGGPAGRPPGRASLRITARGGELPGRGLGAGGGLAAGAAASDAGSRRRPGRVRARHRLLAFAAHRRPGLRLARTGLVMESLIPSILEQKVTTLEAYQAWRLLVRKYGGTGRRARARPDVYHAVGADLGDDSVLGVAPGRGGQQAGVDDPAGRAGRRAAGGGGRDGTGGGAERLEVVSWHRSWTSAETVQAQSAGAPDGGDGGGSASADRVCAGGDRRG